MSLPPLLFDLDGTISNPAPGFLASVGYAMEKLGIEMPPAESLIQYIGPPLRESMGTLLDSKDTDLIEKAVELYRFRLNDGGKFEAEIFPDIPEVLQHFSGQCHPLYICTGKPEGVATDIVNHFELDHFFRGIYGAKLDGRHCDKADLIRHIWETEKIEATHGGVMIGDTVFDILGAKANGLRTIGVEWGFGKNDELRKAGADLMVSRPLELIDAIENLR